MENIVAKRELIVEHRNRERKLVTIRIGRPYQASEDHWACPVSVDGLYKRLADAGGIDSFQALMLAQNLVKTLLRGVVEDGGKIFSHFDDGDEGSEIDLDAMFGKGL